MTAAVTCCLGLVVAAEPAALPSTDRDSVRGALADRAAEAAQQPASRSHDRAAATTPAPTTPTPTSSPTRAATQRRAAPAKPSKPARPRPVAELTQAQMDNAAVIVRTGTELEVPRRGLVVAIATALQESNLYNLASGVLPESTNHPNQGVGWDHDSVGLFQQRPSSGWGSVADLMRPAYAAERFYRALLAVAGWQGMSIAWAAQSVQVSAFPDAYARHEARAETIVDALLG